MLNTSKIKLVALALIYVLHVAFFDGLMAHGSVSAGNSVFSCSHKPTSNNNFPTQSSYRLLTKHEQSKQAIVTLPDAVDFVSAAFTGFIEQKIQLPHYGALAHLNVSTFKLYRLFGVFLI